MGQTLTNGIYLPDEGERNSYSGLEVNWRTLDALILTVNGKAAPNVANTWTAAQTFTAGITGDLTGSVTGNVTGDLTGTASKAIADEDGTSIKTGYVNVAGNQTVSGDKSFTGSNTFNNILPNATNTYSLGSSSYQWSSVYAQTYYYNGTAWGLDKANTWTQTQTFQSNINLTNTSYTIGTIPSTTAISACYFAGASNYQFGYCRAIVYKTTGQTSAVLTARNRFTNGALSPTGAYVNASFTVNLDADGTGWIQFEDCSVKNDLIPYTTDTYNIGTSTNKWKTLNGINPGGLSLPGTTYTNIDTTGWSVTGAGNTYTPTLDGWVYVRITSGSGNYIAIKRGGSSAGYPCDTREGTALAYIALTVPVSSGQSIIIGINGTIEQCRFIPCQGNV